MTATPWYAVLEYAGTHFSGWQRQPDRRTVQGEFESALERLEGRRVVTHAAGRTDAGVHARGQVVSFGLRRTLDPPELLRALDALTPTDLHVARVGRAPTGFHARKHATARRYAYLVGCDAAARSPFRRPFEWALGRALDAAALGVVARAVAGEHDFRAFAMTGQDKPHYRCDVREAVWRRRTDVDGFIFEIEADRFLHRMVRFLVGMSVEVAVGRRPADDVPRLLAGTSNAEASAPAPPEGLYLIAVRYPQLDEGPAA
jgi:tRNA pseudouridine38-40 synthase